MSENTNTITIPGKTISISAGPLKPLAIGQNPTTAMIAGFDEMKHLMSNKPLRAPVRPKRIG